MKTTSQVLQAQQLLRKLGIEVRDTRKKFSGVRVRAKRYRRVWKNAGEGKNEIFYEFGNAQGRLFDDNTLNQILSNEAQLLANHVNIVYYKVDGLIVTADLDFGYKDGTVQIIGH